MYTCDISTQSEKDTYKKDTYKAILHSLQVKLHLVKETWYSGKADEI